MTSPAFASSTTMARPALKPGQTWSSLRAPDTLPRPWQRGNFVYSAIPQSARMAITSSSVAML